MAINETAEIKSRHSSLIYVGIKTLLILLVVYCPIYLNEMRGLEIRGNNNILLFLSLLGFAVFGLLIILSAFHEWAFIILMILDIIISAAFVLCLILSVGLIGRFDIVNLIGLLIFLAIAYLMCLPYILYKKKCVKIQREEHLERVEKLKGTKLKEVGTLFKD